MMTFGECPLPHLPVGLWVPVCPKRLDHWFKKTSATGGYYTSYKSSGWMQSTYGTFTGAYPETFWGVGEFGPELRGEMTTLLTYWERAHRDDYWLVLRCWRLIPNE